MRMVAVHASAALSESGKVTFELFIPPDNPNTVFVEFCFRKRPICRASGLKSMGRVARASGRQVAGARLMLAMSVR